jgi:DNA primase
MPVTFSPAEVVAYYRVRLPKLNQHGHEWRGPCPIHGGERDSFAVEAASGRWTCHSECQRGGDILDLEQALAKVRFGQAKDTV